MNVSDVGRILLSAARLRCPRCGGRPIFSGPFRMAPLCPGCGLRFEREPGYWIGSIYINYGLTTMLMIALFFGLDRFTALDQPMLLIVCAAFGVAFPLLFFRHARVAWLAVDQFLDPSPRVEPPRRRGPRT